MTKRQIWLIVGVAMVVATAAVGYFVFKGNDNPAPEVPKPITQPNASAPKPEQPDPTVVDNRRHTAAVATLAMLQSYATDNTGSYPKTAVELRQAVDTYGKMIASSTTVVYKQSFNSADAPKPTDMFYYPGYACTGTDPTPSSSRSVAVRYALSDGTYACVAN